MSPLEKIKAMKAAAEEKKNREAREAAERAEKERNEHGEKVKEAREKVGEAQKVVAECVTVYQDTANELVGVDDPELLEQITAIVEESRVAKENAEATLREAEAALQNLEKLGSHEVSSSSEPKSGETKESEPDLLNYESRVDSANLVLRAFDEDFDFQKLMRGEKQNLKFPEDAKRIVDDINRLRRDTHNRIKERDALKKDVAQYLSANGLTELYQEINAAKTKAEKETVLKKINLNIAEIDGYLTKMFTLSKVGNSVTPDYRMPEGDREYVQRNTDLKNFPYFNLIDSNLTPITQEQMKTISILLGNLQREAKIIRESIT